MSDLGVTNIGLSVLNIRANQPDLHEKCSKEIYQQDTRKRLTTTTEEDGTIHLAKLTKIPVIDNDTCVGKGECVRTCPMHALKLVGGRAVLSDPRLCSQCKETTCEFTCPTGAITVKYQKI